MKVFQSFISLALLLGLIWLATGCNQDVTDEVAPIQSLELPFSQEITLLDASGENKLILQVSSDDEGFLNEVTSGGTLELIINKESTAFDPSSQNYEDPTSVVSPSVTIRITELVSEMQPYVQSYTVRINEIDQEVRSYSTFIYSTNLDCFEVEKLTGFIFNSKVEVNAQYTFNNQLTDWFDRTVKGKGDIICGCAVNSQSINIAVVAKNDNKFDYTFSNTDFGHTVCVIENL